MTKQTQTVWTSENKVELIVKKEEDKFYIPLGTIDRKTLEALRDAAIDATKPETQP